MFDAKTYLSKPGWQKSRPGLERISKLMEILGNPQKKLKVVHVAGTNGKGSTSSYINQILIESGYRTGLFTSPFIYEFNERIKINNINISDNDLNRITSIVKQAADKFDSDNHPTEFELITAVGFMYFADQNCDVVVCEVGMGGRFDATNILTNEQVVLSVITSVAFDHTDFLGDSLDKIAFEKAGIIKQNVPVVTSNCDESVLNVLNNKAKELNAHVSVIDYNQLSVGVFESKNELKRNFEYKNFKNLKTRLLGKYQPQNAALAIESCMLIKGIFKDITNDSIAIGIEKTYWPARFELVSTQPYVIIDGGHNLAGVKALSESLTDIFPNKKCIFVMGVLADKDYHAMVKEISALAKRVYTVTPPSYRALDADVLASVFKEYDIKAEPVDINDAIEIAVDEALKDDVVCAFGSLYSVLELTKKMNS